MKSIQKQTACTSVQEPDTTKYVKILVDSKKAAGKNILSISELSWGASLAPQSNSKAAYKALTSLDVPEKVLLNVYQEQSALLCGSNFRYNQATQSLQFSNSLPSYGFKQELAFIQGQIKSCYVLWALYNEHKALRDTFTGILQLPVQWLWKYPGAIQKAWSIKQNGANKKDVLSFLQIIGGSSEGAGASLSYPQVLTYKDNLPAGLTGIHVLTQLGVLFAPKATSVVSNNILPLKKSITGSVSTQYITLCTSRNSNTKIPYAELPSPISPANFIFKKVWGPAACLIIVPRHNRQAILRALKFIISNIVLGTVVLAYTSEGQLLYPDIERQNQIMTYYNNSINNGTTYKEHNKDLAG